MTEVEKCEAIITELRRKRELLIGRGHRLGEERTKLSFSAHAEADKTAQKRLDTVHDELGRFESELKSVDEAIAEAEKRRVAAQAAEAQAAAKAEADEARKLVKEIGECFPYLDRHLTEAARALIAIHDGIAKLHQAGFAFPSEAQLRLGIAAIIQTWAHNLPRSWHDQLRDGMQFLPPHQRKTAISYWAAIEPSLQNAIRQRLGEAERDTEAA
jgi:DNA repair exonuclease SbcCD ATPase subunit